METNKQIVQSVFEDYVNRGNLEPISQYFSEDYSGPTGAKGPAGFLKPIEGLRAAFPDIHYTLDQLVEEGDKVVVHWNWKGTQTGTYTSPLVTFRRMIKSLPTRVWRSLSLKTTRLSGPLS